MAEFLWTFAVQEVLKKTVKLAAEQIALARGFKKELSKLRDCLLMVEAILRDVDRKKGMHDAVRLWVEKLEDIVFEVDVLLDDLAYEDLRREVESQKWDKVSNFISPFKGPLALRVKMTKKIKGITEVLHEHYRAASAVGLVAITSNEIEFDPNQIRETDSFLDEFEVIGRENEVLEIVNRVIDCSNQEALSIIPIVGMGGLGKTTLAKVVFNHEVIKRHFDKTIWVCVSESFVIKKILRAILETLNTMSGGVDSKEALLQELQKELHDKKYFLVLDDVWNEDRNIWNELKACLRKMTQKFGSSIIVTTRSDEVAEIMETHSRHHLRKLSNDNCWSLFKQCAFARELPMTIELEVIQEELVKKCGGIPLVVKVLGGTLKFDENHERLQSTLKSLMTFQLKDEDHILSTIKLSVDRLPSSSLKQCFAYCSNFPKDFEFKKEELIQMWIAQGFIQPSEGRNIMMEDIGDKYFNILLSHSLFQDVVKDKKGQIMYCKMHDLIHDVACAISKSQIWQLDHVDETELFVGNGKETFSNCSANGSRKLHIIISDRLMFDYKIMGFIYLRVLIVHSWYISKLPDTIAKLKHLRYLDISHSTIRELPESIVMLYNLQTLRLGKFIKDLPKNLRKLVSLRHLEFQIDTLDQNKRMPQYLGRLIHLQTLSCFIAGFEKGCMMEELGPLKNLRGNVSLFCLERVKSKEEAMTANLVEKENIYFLDFQWGLRGEREGSNDNDSDVLEGLQPHKNLHVLRIHNFAGELLPNGIFVEKLVEIYLHDCERCKSLPMLGQLSKLEILEVRCLYSVRSIGNELYGNYSQRALFPKLKTFHIFEMSSLEHWEEVAPISNCTIFPCLESLSIVCCPKLMSIPNFIASRCERSEVGGVYVKSLPSFQSLVNLRSLKILGCAKLTKLPNGLEFCASLEKLWISNCSNMKSNPNLQNMHNLSSLNIRGLQKLPEGFTCLSNLKDLSIHGRLQDYDWSPLIHLGALENLVLADVGSGATQLPQQLEHLNTLRSLHISLFDGIEALPEWLMNLTSLETLKLYNCRNLKHLPSREAMSKLTKLNSLQVCGCPRLGLESDLEWMKVSHVPSICFIPGIPFPR